VEFNWTYHEQTPLLVRTFLKHQGISKKLLAKIKFQGGKNFSEQGRTKRLVFFKSP
jgi:23S rRNA pseudouridine1911/1915/1917 synthase